MSKQVTLTDIAKACGTSNVTVSNALADKKGVSDELRRKIKETAEQMGYVSSHSDAQKRDNKMVGVISPGKYMDPNGSFYWALYNSLVNKLQETDHYCLISTLSEQEEKELTLPKFITDEKVGSVISLGQLDERYVEMLKDTGLPVILLDYYIVGADVDSVVTNGYLGGYEITSYLIEQGHRDIGFIGTVRSTSSIFDRYMGYMKAMIEHDLPVRAEWTIDDRDEHDNITIVFPEKLPTAFVCNCDEAAYKAISSLEAAGKTVPDDISIVGYDNYLISEISKPTITTINVDSEFMAEKAVEALLRRITEPASPIRHMTISGELIIKESVRSLK